MFVTTNEEEPQNRKIGKRVNLQKSYVRICTLYKIACKLEKTYDDFSRSGHCSLLIYSLFITLLIASLFAKY